MFGQIFHFHFYFFISFNVWILPLTKSFAEPASLSMDFAPCPSLGLLLSSGFSFNFQTTWSFPPYSLLLFASNVWVLRICFSDRSQSTLWEIAGENLPSVFMSLPSTSLVWYPISDRTLLKGIAFILFLLYFYMGIIYDDWWLLLKFLFCCFLLRKTLFSMIQAKTGLLNFCDDFVGIFFLIGCVSFYWICWACLCLVLRLFLQVWIKKSEWVASFSFIIIVNYGCNLQITVDLEPVW